MRNEFVDLIEYVKNVNKIILDKDNEGKSSFKDYFIFQSSSYVISLLQNLLFDDIKGIGNIYIFRCLIESYSLLLMFKSGDISLDEEELLHDYSVIVEYNLYKKTDKLFVIEDLNYLEEKYNNVKSKYKDVYGSDLKKQLKQRLSWLSEKMTYSSIVEKYCSEWLEIYQTTSIIIHPHDYLQTIDVREKYVDEHSLNTLVLRVVDEMNLYYPFIEKNELYSFKFTLSLYENNLPLIENRNNIKNSLINIANMINSKFGNNLQSEIYVELSSLLNSSLIDQILGYREIVKCKVKPLIELLCFSIYFGTSIQTDENKYVGELLKEHTYYNINKLIGNINQNYIENKSKFLVDYFDSKFDLEYFYKQNIGLYNVSSLTSFVNDNIKKITKDEVVIQQIYLIYEESQLLSHANGYMLQSNNGAFNDSQASNLIIFNILLNVLNLHIEQFVLFQKIEDITSYNKLIYDMKKEVKNIKKYIEKENGLLDYIKNNKVEI